MSRRIPTALWRLVTERASFRCEYCRIYQDDSYDIFEVDHIRSLKHGGATHADNLALSCPDCNRHKGSDFGTFLGNDDQYTRFFNPRQDDWFEHFEVFEGGLYGKTDIGEATIRIFDMNNPDRIIIRKELMLDNRYP